MGKLLKLLLVAAVGAFSFVSCLKDDNRHVSANEAYGMVNGTQERFSIATDMGNVLNVQENNDPAFKIEDGQRVVVNFSVLDRKAENIYDVRVNAIGSVLTKEPVKFSELSEQEQEQIGNDPIEVIDAWFGGKYLNLNFMIFRNDPELAHFINLVVDEQNSTADEVIVTFRHNAFGDQTYTKGYGRVSFDLMNLVPDGKNEMKLTLKWTDYQGRAHSESGIFKLKNSEAAPAIAGSKNNKPAAMSAIVE